MGKIDLSSVLNSRQFEAVTVIDGPVLVLAGAGSGKTRVITYRVYYLIAEKGMSPASILGVTFTNKAADEMKERVVNLVGNDARYVNLMTFHSLGAKILREAAHLIGIENNFSIFDQEDQKHAVKEVLKAKGLSRDYYDPAVVVGMISNFKGEGLAPDDLVGEDIDPNIIEIYRNYDELLRKNNALDFGDLLLKTYQLFLEKEGVLRFYQETFRYIMVDEFQDTNWIQYELIKLLSASHRNIFVVGDDDQTIYSWRGAKPENVFRFVEDFEGAKIVKLEENYRSTSRILKVANEIIAKNNKRMGKMLWTKNPDGEYPVIMGHSDEVKEARWVIRRIKDLLREGYEPGEIAVFYRVNYQSRVIEEELVSEKIPYQVVGGFKFYDRKETKDILSYLRLINNPLDQVSFSRIIDVPPRGIGKKSVSKLREIAERESLSPWEAVKYAIESGNPLGKRFLSFYNLISYYMEEKDNMNVYDLIVQLVSDIEYENYLYKLEPREAEGKTANVMELINSVKSFTELDSEATLQRYLERVALISDADTLKNDNAVSLMTLHTSKGLEFPVVFIVGVNDGLLPHAKSRFSDDEMEEERRLFYVGITRAKEKLFFSFSKFRRVYGGIQEFSPSLFLKELPREIGRISGEAEGGDFKKKNFLNSGDSVKKESVIKKGTVIEHPRWGKGVVFSVEGGRVKVFFEDVGEKLLALEFVEKFVKK